jgi:uncharacterized membrane protein
MRGEASGLGRTLVVCSAVSISVCLIGIFLFAANPSLNSDTALPLEDALTGLKSLSAPSVTALGILLTIVSPLVWVSVALTSFAMKRSLLYCFLSIFVLFLMLLSLAISFK